MPGSSKDMQSIVVYYMQWYILRWEEGFTGYCSLKCLVMSNLLQF
jgi:hypothetical protein